MFVILWYILQRLLDTCIDTKDGIYFIITLYDLHYVNLHLAYIKLNEFCSIACLFLMKVQLSKSLSIWHHSLIALILSISLMDVYLHTFLQSFFTTCSMYWATYSWRKFTLLFTCLFPVQFKLRVVSELQL